MHCPNKKCIYANYINMGVPYCPRSVCVYKTAIEKELEVLHKKRFLHQGEIERIKQLEELHQSIESG